MAELYTGAFAILEPWDAATIKATSRTYDEARRDPARYQHQLRNMTCKQPKLCLRDLILNRAVSPAPMSSSSVSPFHTSESEGTIPDDENDPMSEMVWSVAYSLSFDVRPVIARFGWVAGYAHGWQNQERQGNVDIMLATDITSRPDSSIKSRHARLNFLLPSGNLGIKQGRPEAAISVGGEHMSRGCRILVGGDIVSIGPLYFRFSWTVPTGEMAKYFATVQNYFSQSLHTTLPNDLGLGTPSTNDVQFDRWIILNTAGAGSESVVRSAVSRSGMTAAVIRREYHRPADREAADELLDIMEAIRSRLNDKNHPGKDFVSMLHDSFESNAGELYILMQPLNGLTFDCLFRLENERFRVTFFCQALAAVAALHDAHFLHNDLKPANIMIQSFEPPRVSLVDLSSSIDLSKRNDGTVRALPGFDGTVGFLAPEREASLPGEYGMPSDIWSLGTVGVQLLFRCNKYAPFEERPRINPFRDFDRGQSQEITRSKGIPNVAEYCHRLRQQADTCLEDLRSATAGLATGFAPLLSQMLELDPAKRISAAQALSDPLVANLLQASVSLQPGSKRRREDTGNLGG